MKKASLFNCIYPGITMTRVLYLCFGVSILMFSSCEEAPELVFVVETPLQDYFDRFVDEAAVRGFDVAYATSQVDAHIGDITEENVIGTCSWDQTHTHSVTVDENYWRTANDLQREFVVFHELGHCVLGRDHRDDSDANGNCASIMTSGTGDCRIIYTQNSRTRLVDELFSN
ncbi:MAG TPA: putative metallopeptidase [Saprospiraceae bacterium]|nr:putative metallopeptidase [Saprospiraceae bacterium]